MYLVTQSLFAQSSYIIKATRKYESNDWFVEIHLQQITLSRYYS